jgi:hypothetical protein
MNNDEEQDKPPLLKVVSENPSAPNYSGLEILRATQQAKWELAKVAAIMLRRVAGSASTPLIMHSILDLIDAQKKLCALTGGWLSLAEEGEALNLPQSAIAPFGSSDDRYRQVQLALGMEQIVQGALRLAAHQVLGERPHFGGKYSKRLIKDGIAAIEGACKPSPETSRSKRKAKSSWADKFSRDGTK